MTSATPLPDRGLAALATAAFPWIVALALAVRLAGLGWDGFQGLHPDEGNLVRASLALGWPDRLLPDFHAYNGLAVWLPRLVAWPVCGWEGADIACVTWAARLISALAGAAAVLVGALWARDLAGPVAGAAAALLLGLSEPLIQWAHFGTTESGLILVGLLLARLSTALIEGRLPLRRAAWICGVTLGLGLGLKTTTLAFGAIPLAALFLRWPGWRPALGASAVAAGLALALWLVTTPAILFAWADWRATLRFEGAVVSGAADVFWTWQFADRRAVLFELRQIWGATEGAGLILATGGLVLALRDRALGRRLLPALVFAALYAAIILSWHARFFRYLAPLLPLLLVLAALAAAHVATRWRSETARVLLIVGLALVCGTGLDRAAGYLAEDPRITAARDLARHVLPGDVVLLEPREVAFAVPPGAVAATLPLEPPLDAAALATALAEGRFLVLLSRRNWSVLPRLADRFPQACALYHGLAEGRLGYRVAARHLRWTPLGPITRPTPPMEETRVVFDAPEVIVLERVEDLGAEEIARRLAEPVDPAACAPERLMRMWRTPR